MNGTPRTLQRNANVKAMTLAQPRRIVKYVTTRSVCHVSGDTFHPLYRVISQCALDAPQSMPDEEVLDGSVIPRGIVVKVHAVARVGLYLDLEVAGVREVGDASRRDTVVARAGCCCDTVTAACVIGHVLVRTTPCLMISGQEDDSQ